MKKNIKSVSFVSLMATQFLGAFNDNAFKIIVTLFAMRILTHPQAHAKFVSLIAGLFIIPFILFSPYAGYLSDRFNKRDIIVSMKLFELLIMVSGFIALSFGNLLLLCIVLFFMAAQSAIFSPAKYGILPEMLDESELSKGNGYMQMWTFLAIILGTAFGGQMMDLFKTDVGYTCIFLIAISITGIITSLHVKKSDVLLSEKKFEVNFVKDAFTYFKDIRKDKMLFLVMLGISFFWFFGAVVQMNILLFGKNTLHLSELNTSILIVFVSMGIGLGSMFAGHLSGRRIEFGLVSLGIIGIGVLCALLGIPVESFTAAIIRLFMLGLFAGFYIVPLNAFFQQQSPQESRGKYLAVLGIVNACAILLGSFFMWIFGVYFQITPTQIFFILGVMAVGVVIYVFKIFPHALLRFLTGVNKKNA